MPRLRVNSHVTVELEGTTVPRGMEDVSVLERYELSGCAYSKSWLSSRASQRQASTGGDADRRSARASAGANVKTVRPQ